MADRISALSEYEKRRRSNIMEREELFRVVLEAKGKVNKAFKKKKKISSGKPKPKEVLTPRKSKRILEGKVRPSPRFIPQAESIQDYKLRTLEPEETHFKYSTMEKDLEELKTTFTEFADNITVPKKKWIYYNQDLFIEKFSGYQSLMGKDAETETIMGRITGSAIHPTKHMILGCAANFEGKIFLGRFTESEAQYTYFRPHHEKIFHQTWDIYKPEQMITSSYDGTVRIFDIRSLEARLMYGDRNFIESDGGCFTHAQVDRDTFLISKGNKNGGWISVMDTRKSIFPVQEYFVSEATAYMTSIDVCPTKKENLFIFI